MSQDDRVRPYNHPPDNPPYTASGLLKDYIEKKGANEPRNVDWNVVAVTTFQKLAHTITEFIAAEEKRRKKPWWRRLIGR